MVVAGANAVMGLRRWQAWRPSPLRCAATGQLATLDNDIPNER